MLQVLVGYVQDLDIPIGWLVITGTPSFSRSQAPAQPDPWRSRRGPLGAAEADHYARMVAANAVELVARFSPAMSYCCTTRRPPRWPPAGAGGRPGGMALPHRPRRENDVTRARGSSCGRTWPPRRPTCSRARNTPAVDPRCEGLDHPPSIDPFSRRTRSSTPRPCGPSSRSWRCGLYGADGSAEVHPP